MLNRLYLLSKKIHRLLLLAMLFLGGFMTASGIFMKYHFLQELLPGLDALLVRRLHNTMSFYFSILLTLMALSGLYMYFFPWLKKKFSKKQTPTSPISG